MIRRQRIKQTAVDARDLVDGNAAIWSAMVPGMRQ